MWHAGRAFALLSRSHHFRAQNVLLRLKSLGSFWYALRHEHTFCAWDLPRSNRKRRNSFGRQQTLTLRRSRPRFPPKLPRTRFPGSSSLIPLVVRRYLVQRRGSHISARRAWGQPVQHTLCLAYPLGQDTISIGAGGRRSAQLAQGRRSGTATATISSMITLAQ